MPQGSVLGPALFLIFVADASDMVKNFISLYADDTKLHSYILDAHSPDDAHTTLSLQEDLNILAGWCESMQMSYNLDKCHIIHMGKHNPEHQYTLPKVVNYKKTANYISYDLKFHNLAKVLEEKDLGVIVDSELNFRKHISEKISKANTMLFLSPKSGARISISDRVLPNASVNLSHRTTQLRPHRPRHQR